jgi:hypothetical protein
LLPCVRGKRGATCLSGVRSDPKPLMGRLLRQVTTRADGPTGGTKRGGVERNEAGAVSGLEAGLGVGERADPPLRGWCFLRDPNGSYPYCR